MKIMNMSTTATHSVRLGGVQYVVGPEEWFDVPTVMEEKAKRMVDAIADLEMYYGAMSPSMLNKRVVGVTDELDTDRGVTKKTYTSKFLNG